MEPAIYRITLNINRTAKLVSVGAQKGDSARRLIVSLAEDGKPYRIAEGCHAVLSGKKPDGNPLFNDCVINGNTIIYDFTPQTVSAVGRVECELRLYGSDDRQLTSADFEIVVHDRVLGAQDDVGSAPEFDALDKLVSQATEKIEKTQEATSASEVATQNANVATAAANQAASNASAVSEELLAAKERGDFKGDTGKQGEPGKSIHACTGQELSDLSGSYIVGDLYIIVEPFSTKEGYKNGDIWEAKEANVLNSLGNVNTEAVLYTKQNPTPEQQARARANMGAADEAEVSAVTDGYVTPEMFGAVGDGTTDDSDAIQAAINTQKTVSFTKTYAIKKPVELPERLCLDCGGATFNISEDGKFLLSAQYSTLANARINNNGTAEAIQVARSWSKVLNCHVNGKKGTGTGVLFATNTYAGITYSIVRDCHFYFCGIAVSANSESWISALTLDYYSVNCKQAFSGNLSGSIIKIMGQTATLSNNNNELYQIDVNGHENDIVDKLYDVGNANQCAMGYRIVGGNNIIRSFCNQNTNAITELQGKSNRWQDGYSSACMGSPDWYHTSLSVWQTKMDDAVSATVNADETTMDQSKAHEILNKFILGDSILCSSTYPKDAKAVFDIELRYRISQLDYISFSFWQYFGLKEISITLISDEGYDPIVLSTKNISKTTVLYGSRNHRSLYSKNYNKLKLEFVFDGEQVEFKEILGCWA